MTFSGEIRSEWLYRLSVGSPTVGEDDVLTGDDSMQSTDLVDPELIGHSLDLSRPELRSILDRFMGRTALVVEGKAISIGLKSALLARGWRVHSCGGPARSRCPLLEGKSCYLRESADVAIVYINGTTSEGNSALPRLLCAADRASPAVIVLEGRLNPPTTKHGFGVVGALRDPETIMKAVTAVTDPEAGEPEQP
jgi:hypothetical protein